MSKSNAVVVVHLMEEYGYRFWTWYPEMSHNEFIQWWKDLETVKPFFFEPDKTLPGRLIQKNMHGEEFIGCDEFKGHLHEDDDSWLIGPSSDMIVHKGYYLKR